jgi:anti-anti-sigma regulatory factor
MSTISRDVADTGDRADHHRIDPARMATRPGASDLEAVTGPLPVVDLEDGHLHVTTRRDVTILSLDGGLDDQLAASIVAGIEAVLAGARAVIVELDHVTLLDRSALDTVLAVLDRLPPDVARCLVAGRLSGRLVLDRWGVPGRFVVFSSVADALQAREFVASGYGTGWRVAG